MKFEDILKLTQEELFDKLSSKYWGAFSNKGKYILVKGEAPIMLVAHLDTVHHTPVKHICKSDDGNIIMSPQGIGGDDRCGVYSLTKVYKNATKKPWLLFTCDEETGGHGADKFVMDYQKEILPIELDNLKLIIEIDRKGKNDAVYYDCANTDLETYITSKGFKTEHGSFSDISLIAPALGIAAVNLSSGYYNAHTQHEYINKKHLENTISRVAVIVAEASHDDFSKYEYIDAYSYYEWDYGYDWAKLDKVYEYMPAKYDKYYSELLDYYDEDFLLDKIVKDGYDVLKELYDDVFNHYTKVVEGFKGSNVLKLVK